MVTWGAFKTPLPSPPANPDGTGLGVLFMLEFLQAPQVALMSSWGCATRLWRQAHCLFWGRRGLWKPQRLKVSWGESKHPPWCRRLFGLPADSKQAPGSLHSGCTACCSQEFFSWNVSISVWGSYSVVKEPFLQPHAWVFSLPDPVLDIL